MYRIKLATGHETDINSFEELSFAVTSGIVTAEASVFHARANKWLPITDHPHYRKAVTESPPPPSPHDVNGQPTGREAEPVPRAEPLPRGEQEEEQGGLDLMTLLDLDDLESDSADTAAPDKAVDTSGNDVPEDELEFINQALEVVEDGEENDTANAAEDSPETATADSEETTAPEQAIGTPVNDVPADELEFINQALEVADDGEDSHTADAAEDTAEAATTDVDHESPATPGSADENEGGHTHEEPAAAEADEDFDLITQPLDVVDDAEEQVPVHAGDEELHDGEPDEEPVTDAPALYASSHAEQNQLEAHDPAVSEHDALDSSAEVPLSDDTDATEEEADEFAPAGWMPADQLSSETESASETEADEAGADAETVAETVEPTADDQMEHGGYAATAAVRSYVPDYAAEANAEQEKEPEVDPIDAFQPDRTGPELTAQLSPGPSMPLRLAGIAAVVLLVAALGWLATGLLTGGEASANPADGMAPAPASAVANGGPASGASEAAYLEAHRDAADSMAAAFQRSGIAGIFSPGRFASRSELERAVDAVSAASQSLADYREATVEAEQLRPQGVQSLAESRVHGEMAEDVLTAANRIYRLLLGSLESFAVRNRAMTFTNPEVEARYLQLSLEIDRLSALASEVADSSARSLQLVVGALGATRPLPLSQIAPAPAVPNPGAAILPQP